MNFIKRLSRNFKSIVANFVTGVGLFWLFIEIASYSTKGTIDVYTRSVPVFVVAFIFVLMCSIMNNLPKLSFAYKMRDKDNFIEVKVGDAFANHGALVIPVNSHFDIALGGNVRKATSLQNKLILQYYSEREVHLQSDIAEVLDLSKAPYPIGTTIEIEQKNKVFYLLANTNKKENNRSTSTVNDFSVALPQLWTFIANESRRNSVVTIPLINTNNGRVANLNRATALKEIIESYIIASRTMDVVEKLIISIFPGDFENGYIDLDEIDEFLKFSCRHHKTVILSDKPEGQAIETSSEIKSIIR